MREKELWNKYYANRSSYNYGISGDNTQNVLWRIQNNEFDGLSPNFVVLKIGNVKVMFAFSSPTISSMTNYSIYKSGLD
jgi:hypothetical protein